MAARGDLKGPATFVLTLEVDGQSFAVFDALRRKYYPPERNVVPAHVTLFHRLPGERGREVRALLATVAASRKPFVMSIGDVKATERGVATFLDSRELHALRGELAREWEPWLIDQDRRGFRPHVTVAGDIGAGEARRIADEVAAVLRHRRVRATGLHLWRYLDGPWRHESLSPFR
jgi:2'-5' RNA ligase